ncbi:DNA primase [Flavobacterium salilacus subsp. salilacus]|uniref:DNA primase n=1 Tax=Flavobacterium TaxID=237 RepID=UPI001074C1A6|nr:MULTISPECIES: DNA primase [Flavobacterium]KAF2518113.1 DNA primase [Flavobacterium salilacus subsp. salilacus]MBE1615577.1 DNA primase [Flavobacterium sp. SaA2.13]
MISKNTIDTVFETARVEEVIGDFVQLKRAGSNLKGLSPFSNEKSPSFMVSPVKQIWKDFSSGKGGNAVAFLMEHEHFSYPEAIRYLANKYNIEIEETEQTDQDKEQANEKESMYLVSEFAQKYFHNTMLNTDEGQAVGYSYFKERGFTGDTIKKFGLGYSPEVWDAFTKEALGKGYKQEFLDKTGLTIIKEDGRHIDRFRGRVMFPIQSMSGRVLGFGGRILGNDKKAAKYLNSPESDIYHKSKVLYGIYHAKQAIAKQDNCYLVEGYTDVIQMHQAGIENVVASSGTALTPDQIRLINRLTKNITVLFDGDAAGLRASIRGIDLILEEGMNVKVCTFPEGEDPDSFAKKSTHDELVAYLATNAKDFIQFKASLLVDEAKNDPVKKAGLIRDMVTSIAKIPDRIQREVYIQECARIMDISEQVLASTLAQLVQKDITDAGKKLKEQQKAQTMQPVDEGAQQTRENINIQDVLERKIIEILLLYGSTEQDFEDVYIKYDEFGKEYEETEHKTFKVYERIYLNLQEDEIEFTNPVFKDLYKAVIDYYLSHEEFSVDAFLNTLLPELQSVAADIYMQDEKYHLHEWEEKKQIPVKEKSMAVATYATEHIIDLRWLLLGKLIQDLKLQVSPEADNMEILMAVKDYNMLINYLSRKISRIRSSFY